jgi:hypothetical protein
MPRGGKRKGAGRPIGSGKGEGVSTKVVRVSSDISKEQLDNLQQLKDLIDAYEIDCMCNKTSPRYHFAAKLIEEIRALGY